jgi:hypothetical protein
VPIFLFQPIRIPPDTKPVPIFQSEGYLPSLWRRRVTRACKVATNRISYRWQYLEPVLVANVAVQVRVTHLLDPVREGYGNRSELRTLTNKTVQTGVLYFIAINHHVTRKSVISAPRTHPSYTNLNHGNNLFSFQEH